MDDTGRISITIALGILVGLFYMRRTGWSAGGLVTPGLLALQAANPFFFGGTLFLGGLFAAILRPVGDRLGLYGRERVGAALLIAIAFRLMCAGRLDMDAFWIGWIAPGLIACDIDRQGAAMTFAAAVSCSLATAILFFAGSYLWGMLP